MDTKNHCETPHGTKASNVASWYAPHPTESRASFQKAGLPRTASLVGVGGGDPTLADDLLAPGNTHASVLDISAKALERWRHRA